MLELKVAIVAGLAIGSLATCWRALAIAVIMVPVGVLALDFLALWLQLPHQVIPVAKMLFPTPDYWWQHSIRLVACAVGAAAIFAIRRQYRRA